MPPKRRRHKKGGAVPGHTGHGRNSVTEETADLVIDRDAGEVCPECGIPLVPHKETDADGHRQCSPGAEEDTVPPSRQEYARTARRSSKRRPPSFPEVSTGIIITAQVAVMHYFHGIPMGRICEMTGINLGSLVDIFHRLGRYFAPCMEALKNAYRAGPGRSMPMKQAGETTDSRAMPGSSARPF